MNIPIQDTSLTDREKGLVQTLRLLGEILPGAFNQIEEQIWKLVGQHLKWDWLDAESVRRATLFMGLDPDIRRESKAITEEFACTAADGLERM